MASGQTLNYFKKKYNSLFSRMTAFPEIIRFLAMKRKRMSIQGGHNLHNRVHSQPL